MTLIHLVNGALQLAGTTVCHPIKSYKKVCAGIATIASYFDSGMEYAIEELNDFIRNGDPTDLQQALKNIVGDLRRIVTHCSHQLAQVPLRDKVKYITAFGKEIFVSGQFFKFGNMLCNRMKPVATNLLQAIRKEEQVVAIAGPAGENIVMRVNEDVQQAGASVKGITQELRISLELFHTNLMKSLDPEIATLGAMFDNKMKGFAEFANKYLKIDYKHILGMELFFDHKEVLRINGFHHDFMNTVEKHEIFKFTNKIVSKCGTYEADLTIGGRRFLEKIFFPAHWSKEKVVSSIYEAYEEFVQLLDNWDEKVWKLRPREVIIKHENGHFILETKD